MHDGPSGLESLDTGNNVYRKGQTKVLQHKEAEQELHDCATWHMSAIHLCGFTTASLSAQDHHIILQNGLHDFLLHASDGQLQPHRLDVGPPLHMPHSCAGPR